MKQYLQQIQASQEGRVKIVKNVALPCAIVFLGALLAIIFITTKPKAARVEPNALPTPVEVLIAAKMQKQIEIRHSGTVIPAQSVQLRPQVTGKITEVDPRLIPGGRFLAGELLLQIDPRDYEFAVEQRKAEVENARFQLKEEEGKRLVAEQEWKLLGGEIKTTSAGRELALRIPHIRRAKTALAGAESSLRAAELALERTTLRAPFNCFVQSENIDIGQLVSPQTEIAILIGTDQFRVRVAVPVEQLQWITIPGIGGTEASPVRVVQSLGKSKKLEFPAKVIQLVGDIKPATRTAQLLIEIVDPLDLENKNPGRKIPLLVGAWVDVIIKGTSINNVFVLPQQALREGSKVWIMNKDDSLEIRKVDILKSQHDNTVVIEGGLLEGDRVIINRISTPVTGMKLSVFPKSSEQSKNNAAVEELLS